MTYQHQRRNAIAIGVAAALGLVAMKGAADLPVAEPYTSDLHIFSIDDLQVDFDGTTYGPAGVASDQTAICGLSGGVGCPQDIDPATGKLIVAPFTDKQDVDLYPVDTEFGFYIVDFLGAEPKVRDNDYLEGFVGNIMEGDDVVGIKVSNAATDTYKVKPPLGTWCQGLGGSAIKCSTEHYTVLEHVLSCHEVVPYMFADEVTGDQAVLSFPGGGESFDCTFAGLDDLLKIIPSEEELIDPTPGEQMEPNDNTTVLRDIATSTDYSVTLKDDGKVLYRWGSLIKRPNDIRLYARIPLPEEWKVEGADYDIRSAKLVVKHWITNNPNDQLRPEDLENEAATGRKPSYEEHEDGNWTSRKNCFEGDGDFVEGEAEAIGAGTVLRNAAYAGDNLAGDAPPRVFSSDLEGGFTNAFYTTIDRDPFEWSYVNTEQKASNIFDFIGSLEPLTPEEMEADGLELVSGPRWRLRANKFGQDIPGLEIPLIECSTPPFSHDNIRYEVGPDPVSGEPVTTVINLLDWNEEENGPSPLATSRGWVDVTQNDPVMEAGAREVDGVMVSANGLPMTDDFDLAVYIKGDRKSTALFSAQLVINEYEDVEPVDVLDVTIASAIPPRRIGTNVTRRIFVTVDNAVTSTDNATGVVIIEGDDGTNAELDFTDLAPDDSIELTHIWTAPDSAQVVNWTFTLQIDGVDVDTANASTTVIVK